MKQVPDHVSQEPLCILPNMQLAGPRQMWAGACQKERCYVRHCISDGSLYMDPYHLSQSSLSLLRGCNDTSVDIDSEYTVVVCAGTLPNVGGAAHKEPKLHTSNTDPVSSKTGAGAPNPLTHTKDIDYTPNLTTKPPPTSGFTSGTGTGYNSKPGTDHLTVINSYPMLQLGWYLSSSELLQGNTYRTFGVKQVLHMVSPAIQYLHFSAAPLSSRARLCEISVMHMPGMPGQ